MFPPDDVRASFGLGNIQLNSSRPNRLERVSAAAGSLREMVMHR